MATRRTKRTTPQFQDTIRYLTADEWAKFWAAVDTYRDQVMLAMLYGTGMRVGELVAARIEDLDLERGFVRIVSATTKTKQPRTSVLPPDVCAQLRAYLKEERRRKGVLFRSQRKGPLSVRQLQRLVVKYAKKAGLHQALGENGRHRVTPHALRHTHIVHALARKVPLNAVQKQVGHKNLATTQIYAELAPEQVREAYLRGIDNE
jgi:integrase